MARYIEVVETNANEVTLADRDEGRALVVTRMRWAALEYAFGPEQKDPELKRVYRELYHAAKKWEQLRCQRNDCGAYPDRYHPEDYRVAVGE